MGAYDHLIELLPQKPPSLFLDEVIAHDYLRSVEGAVTFPAGHRVFENHLPGDPLVPGVILIESLAQLAGLALVNEGSGPIRGYLGEISRARFRRTVGPGTRVLLRATLVQSFGAAARFEVSAHIEGARGQTVADAEIVVVRKPE